jgi:hypothetical protein
MTSKRTSDTTSRTQLAARVLRRHLRAVSQAEPEIVFTTRSESVSVIYSDGGVISSSDLRRLLRDRIGHIIRLDFSLGGTQAPNVVLWTALLHDGEIVDGRLILHAQVRPDRATPESTSGTASSDDGSSDAENVGDAGALVAQCQALAMQFVANCYNEFFGADGGRTPDTARVCIWTAYSHLCATGNTKLLIDSMNCFNGNQYCWTFSDCNTGG